MAGIDLAPLPHRDAIAYFTSKGFATPLQSFHHLDVFREGHARDWVVAKAMRDDVSHAIRDEMNRALMESRTLRQFQDELAPRLQDLGWWGRQAMTDPLTGESVDAQLGSMRRLRTIFDTNMRTAHAAGHWAAIQRTKRAFPYLQYIQIDRPTKRHDHTRFHDKIWRVDDPIWLRIYPPNGFFCGCHVIQRTEGWMTRNKREVDPAPELDEHAWVNKRTGEVFEVPRGVHPGFDANPGAAWLDLEARWRAITPDLTPAQRAPMRGVIEGLRLARLGRGVEGLVVTGPEGVPLWTRHASLETPSRIPFDHADIPASGHILHSHISEAPLSTQDLVELSDSIAVSITAIAPGGGLWRVVRLPGALFRVQIGTFAERLSIFAQVLRETPEGEILYKHALALWLEKNGLITYHFHATSQMQQLLDRNADLLRRLIDGTL